MAIKYNANVTMTLHLINLAGGSLHQADLHAEVRRFIREKLQDDDIIMDIQNIGINNIRDDTKTQDEMDRHTAEQPYSDNFPVDAKGTLENKETEQPKPKNTLGMKDNTTDPQTEAVGVNPSKGVPNAPAEGQIAKQPEQPKQGWKDPEGTSSDSNNPKIEAANKELNKYKKV